jgi:MFS family permease
MGVIASIIAIVLEIPSGILADKWGRKKVLIVSYTFATLQILTLIWATTYWHFIIAVIFAAISYSFLSGTNTAFFYDTLKQLKREKDFEKLWARQSIYHQGPLIIAFIASGFLYKISPQLPFYLSALFLIASLIIVFTFKEPKVHKPIEQVNVFTHFKESIKHIFKNRYLKGILLFTILFSIGSDLSYGYGQVYLKQLALPIIFFGIAYTFKSLLVTASSNFAPFLRKKFSYGNLFSIQLILITILLYVMVLTKSYIIGAICFILIAIPHGLFIISKSSYIHKHTKSHHRATVDSMFSFLIAGTFLIIEPATGYLADLYSMKIPFLIVAIALSIYTIYYLIWGRKKL